MHSKTLTLLTLFAVLLGVVACGGGTTLTPAPMRTEAAPGPPVAVAVGGILCRLRPPSAADRPTGARPEQRPAGDACADRAELAQPDGRGLSREKRGDNADAYLKRHGPPSEAVAVAVTNSRLDGFAQLAEILGTWERIFSGQTE
jgi:hypothetical protein